MERMWLPKNSIASDILALKYLISRIKKLSKVLYDCLMSDDCLILNGNGKPLSYFPLSAVDWKTAIKLVFTSETL